MSLLQRATACLSKQAGQEALNAFISRAEDGTVLAAARLADERARAGVSLSPLDGRLIAIKDNICTTTLPTTCASNSLRSFRSPYAATVVTQLEASGAIFTGKTNLDEFGMGSHATHSAFGPTLNPIAPARSAGGSSGGSAAAVASGQCWAALGTDTGGSVRLPAAYCGIVGFKPSYGRLSRHGVVAYANSLDTVGILAQNSQDARAVYDVLDGYDAQDPTSLRPSTRTRIARLVQQRNPHARLRFGVPHECNIQELDPSVRDTWVAVLQSLAAQGHAVVPVHLPSLPRALAAYYILAPAEAASNLAKYDGVRYGLPPAAPSDADAPAPEEDRPSADPGNVLYATTRGAHFGAEARRRILLGAYSLSASAIDNYFLQAQKVRRLVCRDFDAVFALPNALRDQPSASSADPASGVDVLLTPTAPAPPPTLAAVSAQSPLASYRSDVLTVPASLAGLPAISVPAPARLQDWGDAMKGGVQVVAQFGDEHSVFWAADVLEGLEGGS